MGFPDDINDVAGAALGFLFLDNGPDALQKRGGTLRFANGAAAQIHQFIDFPTAAGLLLVIGLQLALNGLADKG